jgi:hypothetical protein
VPEVNETIGKIAEEAVPRLANKKKVNMKMMAQSKKSVLRHCLVSRVMMHLDTILPLQHNA